jgi:hypothetical protein
LRRAARLDGTKDIQIRPGCKGKKKTFFTQYFSEPITTQAPGSSSAVIAGGQGRHGQPSMHPMLANSLGNA